MRAVADNRAADDGLEQLTNGRWETELASGRFAAVGRLASGLAHELNNPLSVIVGCSHLAADVLPASHAAATQLRAIERAALRCQALLGRLVEFAAAGAGPEVPVKVELGGTLGAALALVEPLARHRCLEVAADLGGRRIHLRARPRALETAFVHLAAHVVERAVPGGRLDVRARAAGGRADVSLSARTMGAAPRVRGPESVPVGLALAAEIIRRHRGRVRDLGPVGLQVLLPLAGDR